MNSKKLTKVTCQVYKWISKSFEKSLNEAGIINYHVQSSRNVVVREKNIFYGLFNKIDYENDPSEIYRFYIPMEYEDNIVNYLVEKCELNHPGRGSIYTEDVILYNSDMLNVDYEKISKLPKNSCCLKPEFAGITCIIQRGLGELITNSVLDMGFCIPSVTYGLGGGFRDKLGIIRVAIPAEKEIITLTVSKHDAVNVLDTLVNLARLDKPGKGFIYMFPIKQGLINTRLFRGSFKQLASVEQIIQAIDELKQTNNWRRKFSDTEKNVKPEKQKYLKEMLNITFFSNEGYMNKIINKAMNAGAGGATVYKLDYYSYDNTYDKLLPAREMSDLVVNESLKEKIISSVLSIDKIDDSGTMIEISPVPLAGTYNANNKR